MRPAPILAPDPTPEIDWDYRLDSRYEAGRRRVFLTGTQALVRLLLEQRRLDRTNGLNSAGFVSGYRGSPLAGLDLSLWRAKDFLDQEDIRFQPAVNEDLAATAILGTQQVESDPRRQVDGVFALWYGKGPGVDRSGDALKHGNALGSSPRGGVLVVAGDDHGCISSSMPHQSEQAFQAWSMPVLNPASVADYVSFGLYGLALSRFSGTWVGFKAISETVESGAAVVLPEAPSFAIPQDYAPQGDGLHYRWPDLPSLRIEQRLFDKLAAVQAFARANPLDRRVFGARHRRLGIVTTGKAHLDLMAALRALGVDRPVAEDLGISVYKVGLTYPLARDDILEFTRGLDEVLVVEEKRSFVESQLKELLYNLPAERRPRLLGKRDFRGVPLIPELGELSPSLLAPVVRRWILDHDPNWDRLLPGLPEPAPEAAPEAGPDFDIAKRLPYFCAGCPHNRSTQVPEGSQAFSGIGCHFMANWMGRETEGLVQMGGEGVNWIGRAPFTGDGHVFQNLGDGTYYHSGTTAVRQAIAAGVNITYKILFNDAVAMTGGQPVDGKVSVAGIAAQVRAEGVARIAVVSDDPARTGARGALPPDATLHHRSELDSVQRELRDIRGVTVLIYDQACAAEKRRKRKRGLVADPPRRVVINEAVCEACGDCSVQSNCVAVVPKPTPFGVKRQIDQSACNKDFSCLQGFCPSFVTVEGAALRRGPAPDAPALDLLAEAGRLALPATVPLGRGREILVTGVGGTGVVTLGALLTMAAQLEGKGAGVLDFMGFAQKGGAVLSHVKLRPEVEVGAEVGAEGPTRIDRDSADLLLACDVVVATSPEALAALAPDRTCVVGNLAEAPTADFVLRGQADLQAGERRRALRARVGKGKCSFFDATALAKALFGDSVYANLMVLGQAWQQGLIPLSLQAIERAIELNGVKVAQNRQAFAAGRLAAADPGFQQRVLGGAGAVAPAETGLSEIVARRRAFLTDYQDHAYAEAYTAFVARVEAAEAERTGRAGPLSEAVARNLFKLMAYKDEYEVARLYTDGSFLARLESEFEGKPRLVFHLAPPVFNGRLDARGRPVKRRFGPWMLPVLRLLAKARRLRGTAFDPFGYMAERREERALIRDYRALVERLLDDLDAKTLPAAVAVAAAADRIRGFGPVKAEAIAAYRKDLSEKLAAFEAATMNRDAA
ncbi:MAG: indolepyruvate ferredoxin oxidoreductase family protein [Kiloniellales bacterium]|nr:indolepyruvate ferredoxin oxidoreductase family protein [Kiloniellales bacterium]